MYTYKIHTDKHTISTTIVKSVLRGHLWDKEKVVL